MPHQSSTRLQINTADRLDKSLFVRELVTPPVLSALTDVELKEHLRVDLSIDDALIQSIGLAAQTNVENYTRRKLIDQTWRLNIRNGFATDKRGRIELPFAPLSSVTDVKYLDTDGVEQTLATTEYDVIIPSGPQAMPGWIELSFASNGYPSVREQWDSVRITFVSGYGDVGTDDAPASLLAALRLEAGNLYENRESVIVGTVASPLAKTVQSLLDPFRVDL